MRLARRRRLKKNNHTAHGFLDFPYNRMKSAERYDLAKTKSTESLAEHLFTRIVKHGAIILKKVAHVARKKRAPDFDHTYFVQGLKITKLDYRKWE